MEYKRYFDLELTILNYNLVFFSSWVEGNTPPEARPSSSRNERKSYGGASSNISPLTSRLSYENSGKVLATTGPIRKDFKKENFRNWINLDATMETPSLLVCFSVIIG